MRGALGLPDGATPHALRHSFATFFVRYHLNGIPQVDAATWKLNIGGEGANSAVAIGLDD